MNTVYLIAAIGIVDEEIIEVIDAFLTKESAIEAQAKYRQSNTDPEVRLEVKKVKINSIGQLVAKTEYTAVIDMYSKAFTYNTNTTTQLVNPNCDRLITDYGEWQVVSSYVSYKDLTEMVQGIINPTLSIAA